MITPQPVAGAVAHPAGMTGGPRPGGGRWGLALVLTAVLLGALATGATLLTTPTQPEALRFVPSGSAIVVELRPDLPGDQRAALGTLPCPFPRVR